MYGIAKHFWIDRITERVPPIGGVLPLPGRWQCDLAGDRLTWSPEVFDLFGIDRGARIDRRNVVEQYLPESRTLLETLRADAVRSGKSFTFDAQIRRLNGDVRWMRITADVVVRGGRVTHLYGQKLDVTAAFAAGGV